MTPSKKKIIIMLCPKQDWQWPANSDQFTDPTQNRLIKFSVGLPQPAYEFTSERYERSNKQVVQ